MSKEGICYKPKNKEAAELARNTDGLALYPAFFPLPLTSELYWPSSAQHLSSSGVQGGPCTSQDPWHKGSPQLKENTIQGGNTTLTHPMKETGKKRWNTPCAPFRPLGEDNN